MANTYQMLAARVIGVEQVTPLIKRFTLVRQDGKLLPDFTGGSHIIVQMKDADGRQHRVLNQAARACRPLPQ